MDTSKPTLKQKAEHELQEFLGIALYFWVILALFALYRSVILAEEHITLATRGFVLINALALAKVVLIAEALHLGEWVEDWPLIYPTLLKSACLLLCKFQKTQSTALSVLACCNSHL